MKTLIIGCSYFNSELKTRGIVTLNPCVFGPLLRILNFLRIKGIKFPLKYMLSKRKILQCKDFDTIILFDSIVTKDVIIEVSRQIEHVVSPHTKLIFYYWNIIKPTTNIHNKLTKRWEVWTFDYRDSQKFELKFANTFYFSELVDISPLEKNDAFFIGLNKGRRNILDNINSSFKRAGYNPSINIVEGNYFQRKKKYMSYYELRRHIKGSQSLVDVVQDSQFGLTLRTLEAIFFNKKLITNNSGIKEYSFYKNNSSNILITETGNIEPDKLKLFMQNSESVFSDQDRNYYEFNNWFNRLISGTEAQI